MSQHELVSLLRAGPEKIEEAARRVVVLANEVAAIEDVERDLRLQTAMRVASEKDAAGKAVFPNETAREVELSRRLVVDDLYTKTREALRKKREDLAFAKLVEDRERNTFAGARAIARLVAPEGSL